MNGGKKNKQGLTPKQAKFVREYMVDLNATQAAIRAGYSKRTAGVIAAQNLAKAIIQSAIAKIQQEQTSAAVMSRQECLEMLSAISRANVADYVTEKGAVDLKRGDPRAVLEINTTKVNASTTVTKFRLHPKLDAAARLAKMLDWDAPEKHEHSGTIVFRDPHHDGL